MTVMDGGFSSPDAPRGTGGPKSNRDYRPTWMPKGRRKTTSTTSKMPEDVPATDVPEDSSPTSHDQDFVSFVRSTLSEH